MWDRANPGIWYRIVQILKLIGNLQRIRIFLDADDVHRAACHTFCVIHSDPRQNDAVLA